MKIAIKVLTEWDRENVISFFEKHFPYSNYAWKTKAVIIGDVFFIGENGGLYIDDEVCYPVPSDYTILQGVPKDMELPTLEPIKTREQELEECLSDYITLSSLYGSTSESNYTIQLDNLTDKAKQLLNK